MQRAPDCDMVIVHDDDLARIARSRDGEVSGIFVYQSCVLIYAVIGNPSARYTQDLPPNVPA
jgi:hypothetical protein